MKKCSTGLLTSNRARQVLLRGRITKQIAACCVARLLVLASEAPRQPIVMQVDSPGGLITESLMIVSTMKGIKCPVTTICQSSVGGSAVMIAAQGSPGLRVAMPSARFSFHDLLNEPSLTPINQELFAERLAQSTKRSVQEVLEWMAEGAVFSPDEAIANRLIDTISVVPPTPRFADGE
jgi:ATP-dependent Clp protease protease subunit